MRIASGSALFVACLVVASSANGKSEHTSVALPPQRGGRRVASLGAPKKRELYGDLSIDSATENVQTREVTPILDQIPSHPESKGFESTSDRPPTLLEDSSHNPTGNLSNPLESSCTWAAPLTSRPKHPRTTQVHLGSNEPAFPSDLCSLEPSTDVHVYPPLYSGPPNTPLMGSEALILSNPPLSRALAHCSTSLSIWCSQNRKLTNSVDPPGIYAEPLTPCHDCVHSDKAHMAGETVVSPDMDRAEGTCGCFDGANNSVGTHIADGGWVSNLVQNLSS